MNVTDPVCGMEFTEEEGVALGAEVVVKDGRKVWFCCPTCRATWERDHA